jgi:hypothetical protein
MIKKALRKSTGFEVFEGISKGGLCNAQFTLGWRWPDGRGTGLVRGLVVSRT